MTPKRTPSPSDIAAGHVEQIYVLAEDLMEAAVALDGIPYGIRPAVEELLDKPIRPADIGDLAKALKAIADAWQAEIDAGVE